MRFSELIRAAIPGASDDLCEHILWNRTPFPLTKLSAQKVYKAASTFTRAFKNGIDLCDFCDNKITTYKCMCNKCTTMLNSAQAPA